VTSRLGVLGLAWTSYTKKSQRQWSDLAWAKLGLLGRDSLGASGLGKFG